MSSSANRSRKNTAFKPPRPSTSTAATYSRRRSSLELASSSPEPERSADPQTQPTQPLLEVEDDAPLLPPKLLTRLLQHHLTDNSTRIGKDANELVGRYMETFLREALARAVFEKDEGRQDGDGVRGRGRGVGGDFLEVEDLEKVAPQLVLDF